MIKTNLFAQMSNFREQHLFYEFFLIGDNGKGLRELRIKQGGRTIGNLIMGNGRIQ